MRKRINPLDANVGSRVRARRKLLGMSQSKLGTCLGVTFQQIQKYEKGANRIGAGRIQEIAAILDVPVAYFFGAADQSKSTEEIIGLIDSIHVVQLLKAISRIKDPKVLRAVANLVDGIADSQSDG